MNKTLRGKSCFFGIYFFATGLLVLGVDKVDGFNSNLFSRRRSRLDFSRNLLKLQDDCLDNELAGDFLEFDLCQYKP